MSPAGAAAEGFLRHGTSEQPQRTLMLPQSPQSSHDSSQAQRLLSRQPNRQIRQLTSAIDSPLRYTQDRNLSEESDAPGVRSLARRGAGGRRGVVADVAKLAVGRQDYYTREIAQNHEEYLSGHGESPGRWYGAGAGSLGQSGDASTEGLRRTFQGCHPDTGELLGRLQQRSWTAEDGSARSVVEVVAEELGPSLRWATATTTRATSGHQ
jgi:hypothetical protein